MKRKSKILECAREAQQYVDNLERENKKLKRIIYKKTKAEERNKN